MDIGNSASSTDLHMLSEMARTGYEDRGRGLVWLLHGVGKLPTRVWYLSERAAQEIFKDVPDLHPGLEEAIKQYDPEREFVLVEFGDETVEPRYRVLELVCEE